MPSAAAKQWLEIYLDTGDDKKAVAVAYPNVQNKWASSKAWHLKKQFGDEIRQGLMDKLTSDAPVMLSVVSDLAVDSDSEQIKLAAAKDWLDRAGYSSKPDSTQIAIQVNINRDI